jgi:hypothetical protein
MNKSLNPWRTITALFGILGANLLCFIISCFAIYYLPNPIAKSIEAMYSSFSGLSAIVGTALASKSAIQHLGSGKGIKGALKTLLHEEISTNDEQRADSQ